MRRGTTETSRAAAAPKVRCAIYTRKSTEEGLDQAFNTLDAQREAAEAFIRSQQQEGWTVLPTHYDDGGYTGANMDRPALTRLLDDVRNGTVQCVVVYKVDRLTRSLLDFARIIEVLDQHGVTFVSVTQQFNTTGSLGRLTLNILLSFAQFEREMIAERTRDKMSAARRKGKWVGGNPVLGYDVSPQGGSLVVNEPEAERVRAIFGLYLEYGSLIPVIDELDRRGWRLKEWRTRKGKMAGGKPFTKNRLYNLLTNVIYTGRIAHQGQIYPGEQNQIVELDVWNQVQARLKSNGHSGSRDLRNKYGALLKGILWCGKWELDNHYSRDVITVLAGSGAERALTTGMVLGRITKGAATGAAVAGNTGNGTITAAPAVGAAAKPGVYRLTCIEPATDAGKFSVEDPDGVLIGVATVGVAFTTHLTFTIVDGSADFVAGDAFTITVAAGSGKVKQIDFAATDGSDAAYGLLLLDTTAPDGADESGVAIVRNAIVSDNGITWPAGATTDQKNAAIAQLTLAGILVRQSE